MKSVAPYKLRDVANVEHKPEEDLDPKALQEARENERPPRIEVTPELIMGLRKVHCTYDEAASFFGCTAYTFKRLLAFNPEYKRAWIEGINAGKLSLRRLQWRHAQERGSSGVHMTIHLSKHWLHETDKSILEHTGAGGGPVRVVDETLSVEERQRRYRDELRNSKMGQLVLVGPKKDDVAS